MSRSLFWPKRREHGQSKKEVKINGNVTAPVKKGEVLGSLVLKKDGKVLVESPVTAKDDMEKAGFLTFLKRTMGDWTKFK
ncbi:hypothetical protein ACSE3M_00965 [Bacillus velezensis]